MMGFCDNSKMKSFDTVEIMNIFAYGTLMDTDIMEQVSGCSGDGKSAVLEGYQRYGVRGEQYPGIIADNEGKVDGVLYSEVSPAAVRKLDLFEGEMYSREEIRVRITGDSQTVKAMAYVVKQEYEHMLTQQSWDFDSFLENGKKLFENNYYGFGELQEKP